MRDKLTFKRIERLHEPGRYGDGAGLWLQVRGAGNKSWLFRYTLNGRARQMGLGPFPDVGLDPLEERNQRLAKQRQTQASRILFRDAAKAVIAEREAKWHAEHRRQWL